MAARTVTPINVWGINDAGNATNEEVFLFLSAPAIGFLSPVATILPTGGQMIDFNPCNSLLTPDCLGSFRVHMSLLSNPNEVVVSSELINLFRPDDVASVAPCLVGGNILYLNGDADDWIHPWEDTITDADFSAYVYNPVWQYKPLDTVDIRVDPVDDQQGLNWFLRFSTQALFRLIEVGVYDDVQNYPSEEAGHPGLDIFGDARACSDVCGKFQVHEIEAEGRVVKKFTASFEQYCECRTNKLQGCVHVEF